MGSDASKAMHEEVILLLPWYVNGTLSASERGKVQAHLDTCSDCRDEVSFCTDMMASVQQQGPTPILPATTATQILDGARQNVASNARWPRQRTWGIAAGLGLFALLMVIELAPDNSNESENQSFEAATSSTALETVDYVLQLRFADGVSTDERMAVIDELGGGDLVIVAGRPQVRIVVSLPPKSLAELELHTAEIELRREIESAEFVALQIPVR